MRASEVVAGWVRGPPVLVTSILVYSSLDPITIADVATGRKRARLRNLTGG